jgi:hypothetical protein
LSATASATESTTWATKPFDSASPSLEHPAKIPPIKATITAAVLSDFTDIISYLLWLLVSSIWMQDKKRAIELSHW